MNDVYFCCPHCRAHLLRESTRAVCENGHSFDLARKGYVNLLVGRGKMTHGDNTEMVAARTRFLDSGHYAFLRRAACELCAPFLSPGSVFLDAGCGEGYYTAGLLQNTVGVTALGIDISKYALAAAHRRLPNAALAAASLYDLPLGDGSCDLVTLFFSPLAERELCRVLKKGGHLLLAIPARRHLFGLKSLLYDTPYENEVKDYALSGFTLCRRVPLERSVTLHSRDEILSLFRMTPYAYRTSEAGRARIESAESLETELSFELLLYQKD